jgi:hypothetical protein
VLPACFVLFEVYYNLQARIDPNKPSPALIIGSCRPCNASQRRRPGAWRGERCWAGLEAAWLRPGYHRYSLQPHHSRSYLRARRRRSSQPIRPLTRRRALLGPRHTPLLLLPCSFVAPGGAPQHAARRPRASAIPPRNPPSEPAEHSLPPRPQCPQRPQRPPRAQCLRCCCPSAAHPRSSPTASGASMPVSRAVNGRSG